MPLSRSERDELERIAKELRADADRIETRHNRRTWDNTNSPDAERLYRYARRLEAFVDEAGCSDAPSWPPFRVEDFRRLANTSGA
jgi:hypothetical protein